MQNNKDWTSRSPKSCISSWHRGLMSVLDFLPPFSRSSGVEKRRRMGECSQSHKTSFLMKLKPSQGTHLCHLDSSLLALSSSGSRPEKSFFLVEWLGCNKALSHFSFTPKKIQFALKKNKVWPLFSLNFSFSFPVGAKSFFSGDRRAFFHFSFFFFFLQTYFFARSFSTKTHGDCNMNNF